MKSERRKIEDILENLEKEMLYIRGDFNARIAKEGKRIEAKEDENPRRNSKIKEVNNEGKELLGIVEDRGWDIKNENMREDEKEELTHIGGRGKLMLNYVLINQKAWDKIEEMKIGNRTESDHQPLEIEIGIKKERGIVIK